MGCLTLFTDFAGDTGGVQTLARMRDVGCTVTLEEDLEAGGADLVPLVVGCAAARAGAAFCDLVSLVVGCATAGAALLAARGDVPAADMSSEVLLLPVLLRAVLLVDYNQQKQRIISDNRNEEHGVTTRPRITAKIYSTR